MKKTRKQPMLIAGKWQHKDEVIHVNDPGSGEHIATVPKATAEDMEKALESALEGRKIARGLTTRERMNILNKTAQKVEDNQEEIADIIASEGIKTIHEARSEVDRTVDTLKLSAEEARRLTGETINFDQMPGNEDRHGYMFPFPLGIIGAITPFNDPLNLVAHKIGPAIATGNAMILKPASETPLSALWLTEKLLEAGLPGHVLNVLTGSGSEISPPLLKHPAVRMISFTGGVKTGEHIAKQAGLKKVRMELGANSPLLVFRDADVQKAAEAAVSGAYAAAGQNCLSVQRIFVHEDIEEAFTKHFVTEARALKVGNKKNEQSDMGPLISEEEAKRVIDQINQAKEKGAEVLCGGVREGSFVHPTLLRGVSRDSALYQEEVFAPVAMIYSFSVYQEAIQLANEVHYGLQAGLFTNDLNTAHNAVNDLHVGGVNVNDSSDFRIDSTPFGGVKDSGLGREGVHASIKEMSEPRVVSFKQED